jgi:cytoskeletal protein CcmA (bactofilin family)
MFSKLKTKFPTLHPVLSMAGLQSPPAFGAPAVPDPVESPRPRAKMSMMANVLDSDTKPSVVSQGFVMRGDIDSVGVLHVEGTVIGTIKADDINIGSAGTVEGTVICKNLNVRGMVSGAVECDELVIAPSAQIKGEVSYLRLTIGAGATIECEMSRRSKDID